MPGIEFHVSAPPSAVVRFFTAWKENDEKSVVLFLSDKLTVEQRRLMYYFYPELIELDNCCAMTVSQTSETEHYYDIDEYYKDYKIGYQKVMKKI